MLKNERFNETAECKEASPLTQEQRFRVIDPNDVRGDDKGDMIETCRDQLLGKGANSQGRRAPHTSRGQAVTGGLRAAGRAALWALGCGGSLLKDAGYYAADSTGASYIAPAVARLSTTAAQWAVTPTPCQPLPLLPPTEDTVRYDLQMDHTNLPDFGQALPQITPDRVTEDYDSAFDNYIEAVCEADLGSPPAPTSPLGDLNWACSPVTNLAGSALYHSIDGIFHAMQGVARGSRAGARAARAAHKDLRQRAHGHPAAETMLNFAESIPRRVAPAGRKALQLAKAAGGHAPELAYMIAVYAVLSALSAMGAEAATEGPAPVPVPAPMAMDIDPCSPDPSTFLDVLGKDPGIKLYGMGWGVWGILAIIARGIHQNTPNPADYNAAERFFMGLSSADTTAQTGSTMGLITGVIYSSLAGCDATGWSRWGAGLLGSLAGRHFWPAVQSLEYFFNEILYTPQQMATEGADLEEISHILAKYDVAISAAAWTFVIILTGGKLPAETPMGGYIDLLIQKLLRQFVRAWWFPDHFSFVYDRDMMTRQREFKTFYLPGTMLRLFKSNNTMALVDSAPLLFKSFFIDIEHHGLALGPKDIYKTVFNIFVYAIAFNYFGRRVGILLEGLLDRLKPSTTIAEMRGLLFSMDRTAIEAIYEAFVDDYVDAADVDRRSDVKLSDRLLSGQERRRREAKAKLLYDTRQEWHQQVAELNLHGSARALAYARERRGKRLRTVAMWFPAILNPIPEIVGTAWDKITRGAERCNPVQASCLTVSDVLDVITAKMNAQGTVVAAVTAYPPAPAGGAGLPAAAAAAHLQAEYVLLRVRNSIFQSHNNALVANYKAEKNTNTKLDPLRISRGGLITASNGAS